MAAALLQHSMKVWTMLMLLIAAIIGGLAGNGRGQESRIRLEIVQAPSPGASIRHLAASAGSHAH